MRQHPQGAMGVTPTAYRRMFKAEGAATRTAGAGRAERTGQESSPVA
ncbi:hypothetical protein ACFV0V_11245 [Streptomyces bottropensis]